MDSNDSNDSKLSQYQKVLERTGDLKHNQLVNKYELDVIDQRILLAFINKPDIKLLELSQLVNLSLQAVSTRLKRPTLNTAIVHAIAPEAQMLDRIKRKAFLRMEKIAEEGANKHAIAASRVMIAAAMTDPKSVQVVNEKPMALEEAAKIVEEDPASGEEEVIEIEDL